jgi:hypothetical protein
MTPAGWQIESGAIAMASFAWIGVIEGPTGLMRSRSIRVCFRRLGRLTCERVTNGAFTMIPNLIERVAWLERKVVELLYALIGVCAMFAGWVVAGLLVGPPSLQWEWQIVFVVSAGLVGLVLHRTVFKGSPGHIEYIAPYDDVGIRPR